MAKFMINENTSWVHDLSKDIEQINLIHEGLQEQINSIYRRYNKQQRAWKKYKWINNKRK